MTQEQSGNDGFGYYREDEKPLPISKEYFEKKAELLKKFRNKRYTKMQRRSIWREYANLSRVGVYVDSSDDELFEDLSDTEPESDSDSASASAPAHGTKAWYEHFASGLTEEQIQAYYQLIFDEAKLSGKTDDEAEDEALTARINLYMKIIELTKWARC
jgi:hypothetical protein